LLEDELNITIAESGSLVYFQLTNKKSATNGSLFFTCIFVPYYGLSHCLLQLHFSTSRTLCADLFREAKQRNSHDVVLFVSRKTKKKKERKISVLKTPIPPIYYKSTKDDTQTTKKVSKQMPQFIQKGSKRRVVFRENVVMERRMKGIKCERCC
jgi:hypothetical protein